MSAAPFLTRGLLSQLADAWTAQGAAIAGQLAPGLSDDEMDELTAPLGVRLPLEARVWWGWHDGVPWRTDGERTTGRELGPGMDYLPLRDAVSQYLRERRNFTQVMGDPEPYRPKSFLTITYRGGPIMCDCAVAPGSPTPIYLADSHDSQPQDVQNPVARSFGEMVTWWIEAMRDDIWHWDSRQELWKLHHERIEGERATSGIV